MTAQKSTTPPPTPFNLDEPGTIAFTAERAFTGRRLSTLCLSLRDPVQREEFVADPTNYVMQYGLDAVEQRLVRERDWTGLLLAGCHLQALLKLAATVGCSIWDIGAHNVGMSLDDLMTACPRVVSAIPGGWH